MSFLPHDDRQFLAAKEMAFVLKEENLPDGNVRRVVEFPDFAFEGAMHSRPDPNQPQLLVPRSTCRLAIVIPSGYATTKLDSFYTIPRLVRNDGADPHAANGSTDMLGETWQFWSRHLDNSEWRPGVDSLETYVQYVRGELRRA